MRQRWKESSQTPSKLPLIRAATEAPRQRHRMCQEARHLHRKHFHLDHLLRNILALLRRAVDGSSGTASVRHQKSRPRQEPGAVRLLLAIRGHGRSRECVLRCAVAQLSGRSCASEQGNPLTAVPTYASIVSATKRRCHNQTGGFGCSSSTVGLCTCFLCARADRTGVHVVLDIVPRDNVRPIEFLVGPCVRLAEPVCASVSTLHPRRQGQSASNVHGGPQVFFSFLLWQERGACLGAVEGR